jgi:hypothetical protein
MKKKVSYINKEKKYMDKKQRINKNEWYCDRKNWQCHLSNDDDNNPGEFKSEQDCWRSCNTLSKISNLRGGGGSILQTQILPLLDFHGMTNLFQTNQGLSQLESDLALRRNLYEGEKYANIPLIDRRNRNHSKNQYLLQNMRILIRDLNLGIIPLGKIFHEILEKVFKWFNYFGAILTKPNKPEYFGLASTLNTPQVLKMFIDLFIALYRYKYTKVEEEKKEEDEDEDNRDEIKSIPSISPLSSTTTDKTNIEEKWSNVVINDITKALTIIYRVIHVIIETNLTPENYSVLVPLYIDILSIEKLNNYISLRDMIFLKLDLILEDLKILTYHESGLPNRQLSNIILQCLVELNIINNIKHNRRNVNDINYDVKNFEMIKLKIFNLIFYIIEQRMTNHLNLIGKRMLEENENQNEIEIEKKSKTNWIGNREIWDNLSILFFSEYEYTSKILELIFSKYGLISSTIIQQYHTSAENDIKIINEPLHFNVVELMNNYNDPLNLGENIMIKNFWLNFIIYSCLILGREAVSTNIFDGIIFDLYKRHIVTNSDFMIDFAQGGSPLSNIFGNNFVDFSRWFKIYGYSLENVDQKDEQNYIMANDINAHSNLEFLRTILSSQFLPYRDHFPHNIIPTLFVENMIIFFTTRLISFWKDIETGGFFIEI